MGGGDKNYKENSLSVDPLCFFLGFQKYTNNQTNKKLVTSLKGKGEMNLLFLHLNQMLKFFIALKK